MVDPITSAGKEVICQCNCFTFSHIVLTVLLTSIILILYDKVKAKEKKTNSTPQLGAGLGQLMATLGPILAMNSSSRSTSVTDSAVSPTKTNTTVLTGKKTSVPRYRKKTKDADADLSSTADSDSKKDSNPANNGLVPLGTDKSTMLIEDANSESDKPNISSSVSSPIKGEESAASSNNIPIQKKKVFSVDDTDSGSAPPADGNSE